MRGGALNPKKIFEYAIEEKIKILFDLILQGFKLTVEHSEQCIFKDEEYSRYIE